jgi:hypothetical protein
MPKNQAWTEEDFAKLREMIGKGRSARTVALALRRPVDSVKTRAREIGMPFRHELDLKRERQRILGTSGRFNG